MRAKGGILYRFQQQKSQDFLRVQSTAFLNEHIVLLYSSVLKLICQQTNCPKINGQFSLYLLFMSVLTTITSMFFLYLQEFHFYIFWR